jgi:hypothetical protein
LSIVRNLCAAHQRKRSIAAQLYFADSGSPRPHRPKVVFIIIIRAQKQSGWGNLAMQIIVKALRTFAIVVLAATSVTAMQAQSDDDTSISRKSCADVKPPPANPADMIDKIPIYLIAPGVSGHRATCRATEALAEGMVDVELSEDRLLSEALGDPVPDTNTGEVSEFPYSAPGSRPTPGLPPPGPSPELPDRSQAYAAFVDPTTGVEYTFSSVAENLADAEEAAAAWIRSTVEPLLKQHAAKASAQVTANATFAAADTIGTPSYDTRAWTLLIDATIAMPGNKLATGFVREFSQEFGRDLGQSGATVRVYRLNGNQADSDYFLVDTAYTQTPEYKPFDFVAFLQSVNIFTWANRQTDFNLTAEDPNHPSTIKPTLYEFAPRTPVTSKTETFSVGAELSGNVVSGPAGGKGAGGGVSASYSVTTNQESVGTNVKGTLGTNNLQWVDTYNGFKVEGFFPKVITPPTSINTFTGERLAIYKVPSTVNDEIPQGKHAGLNFTPRLESHVHGIVSVPAAGWRYIYAGWNISGVLFVPEPQFSASTEAVTISRSKNSVNNPVKVNIVAQLPTRAQKISWQVTTTLNSIAAVASVARGDGYIDIYPKGTSEAGEKNGDIFVDSSPGAAANSLRDGPIRIKVTIVD